MEESKEPMNQLHERFNSSMSQIEEQESKLERSDIQADEPSLRPMVPNKLNLLNNLKNTIEPEERAMRSPIQSKGNRSRHKSDINK